MLTRKPLTITVMVTHQRWDGLAGSRSPPMRDPDCGRAVASGRAMVTAYPWGNPQTCACKPLTGQGDTWPAAFLRLRIMPPARHQLAQPLPRTDGCLPDWQHRQRY